MTLTGAVAIPDAPADLVVLGQNVYLAHKWQSCPETSNNSILNPADGSFLLESTNNCAGAQFVYFYADSALNLESFSDGFVVFKIQANNANQNLQLRIQDSDTTTSNAVNLAAYGFDSTAVAVDQSIEVPITALVTADFDLSSVIRAFQLDVTCPHADCFTTVADIRWIHASIAAAPAPLAVSTQRRWPRCEPRSCKAVPQARVGIFQPGRNGWTAEPAAEPTLTDSNGEFRLTIDWEILQSGGPFFIASTSFDGSFTLLSPIPGDLIEADAEIEIAVDRTTTAASVMVCPNGLSIPADGSGGWCIGDPISTTELEPLYDTIDLSLTISVSLEIEVIVEDVLDDGSDVIDALNQILNAQGIPDVTTDDLVSAVATLDLPSVPAPGTGTSNDLNDEDDNTSGGNFTSAQCSEYLTCDVCSISACVSASQSSCEAGYKTSDGAYFQCANCSDCFAAAQNATNHCCPVQ